MVTKDIKYWLEEPDLKTPEHDKMVLWCMKNYESILKNLNIYPENTHIRFNGIINHSYGRLPYSWDWEHLCLKEKEKCSLSYINFEEEQKLVKEDYNKILKKQLAFKFKSITEMEVNLKKYSVYTPGFIDVGIYLQCDESSINSEYFSMLFTPKKQEDYGALNYSYFIEVKPEIKSMGFVTK